MDLINRFLGVMALQRAFSNFRFLALFLSFTLLGMVALGLEFSQSAFAASSRVEKFDVPAPALAGNLLETPTVQGVAVYLPPGYDQESDRRYPVLYLLHGIFDNYDTWLEHFAVPELLDRLIKAGAIPELLVVMPNGGNKYGGGFYRNSPVSGDWGDYITRDLVGFVDAQFRTRANEGGRAIVGHSMGGYGALHLVMTYPGVFSAAWAMSPCCLTARDDFGFGNDAWKRTASVATTDDIDAIIEDGDFYAVATLGVLAAFSPNADNAPTFGDFPFELVRNEIVLNDETYDRYLDALPTRQVRTAREALRNLRGLAIGVGLGDQFLHIPTGTLELSQRLGAERIPHLLDVYAGDHRQLVSERLESLIFPWIGKHLLSGEP